MINIDDLKNELVMCLRKNFTNVKFYKDGSVKSYPNFYIKIINLFLNPVTLMHQENYKLNIFVRIEYRQAEEPTSVINLNSILDDVGFKMLDCLKTVQIYNKYYYTDITNNETIDNIRIFEFNFSIYVQYDKIKNIKMQNMEYKGVE